MLEIDAIMEAGRMAREYQITTSVSHAGIGTDDYNVNFMPAQPFIGVIVAAFDSTGEPMQFWGFSEFSQRAMCY